MKHTVKIIHTTALDTNGTAEKMDVVCASYIISHSDAPWYPVA